MKFKFYFYEVGFRTHGSWDNLRRNLIKVVAERQASIELEKSNKKILQGTYVEEDDKSITVFDIEGNASKMVLKNYLKCEFWINRELKVLLVKNPKRGVIRNLVSIFEDATKFEIFVEPKKWNIRTALIGWSDANLIIDIQRVDIEDFLYNPEVEGCMKLQGNINLKIIDSVKSGRLAFLSGQVNNKNTLARDFSIYSNGVLRFNNSVSFENVISFLETIGFKF